MGIHPFKQRVASDTSARILVPTTLRHDTATFPVDILPETWPMPVLLKSFEAELAFRSFRSCIFEAKRMPRSVSTLEICLTIECRSVGAVRDGSPRGHFLEDTTSAFMTHKLRG
jgi:hypothetical protein